MKRQLLFGLFRLFLAVGIAYALPYSHMKWGQPFPGDGQEASGFIIIFTIIGAIAGTVFLGIGFLLQFFLRKRDASLTVIIDVILFMLLNGILVYGGITAEYEDSDPVSEEAAP